MTAGERGASDQWIALADGGGVVQRASSMSAGPKAPEVPETSPIESPARQPDESPSGSPEEHPDSRPGEQDDTPDEAPRPPERG